MRRIRKILLWLCLLLSFCACGQTGREDPLPFIPAKDDGLQMTDRGRLRIEAGKVTAANITVMVDGFPADRTLGNLKREDRAAAATKLTVGQFRTMTDGLLEQLPQVLGVTDYRLDLWPAAFMQGADAFPCWTYSLSEKSLTEGISAAVDQASFGRLNVVTDGVVAHILIEA